MDSLKTVFRMEHLELAEVLVINEEMVGDIVLTDVAYRGKRYQIQTYELYHVGVGEPMFYGLMRGRSMSWCGTGIAHHVRNVAFYEAVNGLIKHVDSELDGKGDDAE